MLSVAWLALKNHSSGLWLCLHSSLHMKGSLVCHCIVFWACYCLQKCGYLKSSFLYVPSLSLLFQTGDVSDNAIIFKNFVGLLWSLWAGWGRFTPLDKSHTYQVLQNKALSTTASETTETVPLSFIEASKFLCVTALALSAILTKELSLNFSFTCRLERLGIFKPNNSWPLFV